MNGNNFLEKICLLGFFLILALPLFSAQPWFYPPGWSQAVIFRIIVSLLILLFVYQFLFKKKLFILPLKNPVFWFLISLAALFILATVLSLDPNFSFWGDPERGGGTLNFLFYLVFCFLLFSFLKKEDWPKIWNFLIGVGIMVSLVAIFQQFNLFKFFVVSQQERPSSTLGNTIFLAVYLLLLSFPALSFAIKTNSLVKKGFYFLSLALFLFVALFISQTRAVFLGLAIGFLYFLLFYPFKNFKLSLTLKITALVLLISGLAGFFYLNSQPELLKKFPRLSIENALNNPRFSTWKISWQALKERPIFGFGPENFSIAFDKYYDPSLSGFSSHDWWDRAHNFIFDISVTAGLPALIIYLSLFGALFWKLQKIKNQHKSAKISINQQPIKNQQPIIIHGIQAAFIAYLAANLFSFDTFATSLLLFLLIAYSLFLIEIEKKSETRVSVKAASSTGGLRRSALLFGLFCFLIWFIWVFNLKPFRINKEVGSVIFLSKQGNCQKSLETMEKILPSRSILNNFLRLKTLAVIKECIEQNPEKEVELSKKAFEIAKEASQIRPYFTRSWLLLGIYGTLLKEKEPNFSLSDGELDFYFQKAQELSPKRPEILLEWLKADLVRGKYQTAKEKAEQCLQLSPKLANCWWLAGLSAAYLKEEESSAYFLKIAQEKGYPTETEENLLQLVRAYIQTENYQSLVEIYLKLISIKPQEIQYHASLAEVYKNLGEFEKAEEQALKVLELRPEAKATVEEFLKSLPR